MSLFEERDPRFVHLERKVGVFMLLGIAATLSAVVFLGVRQGVFTPRATLFFRAASAEDLGEGAEVLTRGFRIGKVSRLRLDDAGKVEVRLAVDKNALKWVKRDSTARLEKGLLVGGAKVVITSGTSGAPVIGDGGELAFEPGVGLSEAAQQAMDELKPVLRQLAVTLGQLGDPKGDLMTTLANLNRLTADLDETQRGIGAAFASADANFARLAADLDAAAVALRKDVIPEAQALIRSADAAVRDAGGATAALQRQLPPILEKLDAGLGTIQGIALDLKKASVQAPTLLEDGGTLVRDSEELVKRVGGMWLLRSNEPPPTERTIDVDSYQRRK
jgi:phospholipid/cholesterol/gamma-HCH transport system substrate-binding protein